MSEQPDRLLQLLGICMRARQLVSGERTGPKSHSAVKS